MFQERSRGSSSRPSIRRRGSRSIAHCSDGTSRSSRSGPTEIYSMFTMRGQDVGAAYTMRPDERQLGIPPHWNLYVTVADVDEAAKRAAGLGAKVFAPPFDVMDAGRMAVLQDPTGAVFQLWQPAREHRREDPQRAGRALLDRAHDARHERGRVVLHGALRLEGEAQRAGRADGLHGVQRAGPAEHRHDGDARRTCRPPSPRSGCRTSRWPTATPPPPRPVARREGHGRAAGHSRTPADSPSSRIRRVRSSPYSGSAGRRAPQPAPCMRAF